MCSPVEEREGGCYLTQLQGAQRRFEMTCRELPLCPARKEASAQTLSGLATAASNNPPKAAAPSFSSLSQDRNQKGLPLVCCGAPLPARAKRGCAASHLYLLLPQALAHLFLVLGYRHRSQAAGGWLRPGPHSTDTGED